MSRNQAPTCLRIISTAPDTKCVERWRLASSRRSKFAAGACSMASVPPATKVISTQALSKSTTLPPRPSA